MLSASHAPGGAGCLLPYSAISGEGYKRLKAGEEVEFDVILGGKGPEADDVVRTAKAPEPGGPTS